jgi:protein farnesyltransferase subunit beta
LPLQPHGGLRDKPGKSPDYYHTCYCLSGLASSQHHSRVVLGGPDNLLARADPLCNVLEERLAAALEFFGAVLQPH